MALQTGVLENGQWVTRNVDIYQLLALQNRLREDQPPRNLPPAKSAMDQPTLGLLSRTILRSPIVNWIIPARIRQREKNDVLFIGEDFIHLKEILPDANLRHVCTKANFGSRIRAARIFGEPRKFIHPDFQHLSAAEQAQAHADSDDSIPPQFLVLTLESRELLFLFASEREDGSIEWTETSLPLHPDVSALESPGKHLAVDPRSRALAVGSSCNCILLYSSKSMQDVRGSMPADPTTDWWTPLKTEMPIQVRGVILKMEFLFPAPDRDTQVVLIVLYARQGKTRMSCYVWDHSLSPETIKCVLEGYPIPSRQRRPQLLMPLQQGLAFVLVGKQDIDMYQNILDEPTRTPTSLSNPEAPRFPGNSRRFPLWTSWARTDRNIGRNEENFYLIREDGVVNYLAVNIDNGALTSRAGHINCNVFTAFASLDVGPALGSPDVLIAAGDSSQGEVVKIGQWKDEVPLTERMGISGRRRTRAQVMEPDFIASVPNWSPTLDFIVTNQPGSKTGVTCNRRRIISTSGRTPYGSLSELRIGYNARIGLFEEDPIFSGVTGLWSLPDASERGVFFLLSLPAASELLHISDDAQELDMEFDEENCGLDLSLPTLTCANIENGLALQITSRSLVVVETTRSDRVLPRKAVWQLYDEEILAASISPQDSTVYFAIRSTDGFSTRTMRVETGGDEVKFEAAGAKPLQADPTCVQFLWANSKRLVLCATADGLIQLHEVNLDGSLGDILMSQNVQGGAAPGSLAACQSAVILRSSSAGETGMALACGLRNGDVYVVDMSETTQHGFSNGGSNSRLKHREGHGKLCFGKTKRTSLGHTPVVLFEDPESGPLSGFATCGSELHRINLNPGDKTGLEIANIWLTDRMRPYLKQKPVSAICRIPHARCLVRGLGGALMCISGSSIYIVHLGEERHMVPRSIPVRGSPNRVISCPSLKALFVSCNEPVAFEVTDKNGTRCSRFRESFVQMFDDRGEASNGEPAAEYYLDPGWRINALSALELEGHQGKKYCQIMVGTGTTSKTEERPGRVLFLVRKIGENNKPELVQHKELKFREQVTCLCSDANSLVVCAGRRLYYYNLSAGTKSLQSIENTEIPSSGVHVTLEDNFIYVSTASDSLLVYHIISHVDSYGASPRFELVFTDSQARNTSCHVRLPLTHNGTEKARGHLHTSNRMDTSLYRENNVALVSDKGGSVAVLYLPHRRTYQTAVPTLVEAALPRSVMRLRRSTPPQNSRTSQTPGVLGDDIIGAASDGTFFNFSLIDERTWRLLKFLENMCKLQEQERRSRRPGSQLLPFIFDSRATNDLIIAPLRHLDQSDGSPEDILAATVATAASRHASANLADYDAMDLDADSDPIGGGPVLQPPSRHAATTAETLLRALDPDKNRTGLKRRTAYHVDGDILEANFVGRRAEKSLLATLKLFCGGTNVAVWKRFVEVVDAALNLGKEGEQQHGNDAIENDGDGIRAFEGMDISGASDEARLARQGELDAQMRTKCRLVVEWLSRFMDPVL